MATIPIKEVIRIARQKSPYYQNLYRHLPERDLALEELPIVNQEEFWAANSSVDNRLLTSKPLEGILFRSGGTTGKPKLAYYTREEWESFTQCFGRALGSHGLKGAKRVGNLFYAGQLYASFLFIHESLEFAEEKVLNLPLSGGMEPNDIWDTISELEIDTLAGVPTTILRLADALEARRDKNLWVKRILFGGESLYPDQRERIKEIFGDIHISSIGYASVDGGLLGYADESCGPEEHRVFGETVLEIVDEDTLQPITEEGRAGKILITSLTRTLMPIIRYPAGDRAEWTEPYSPTDRNRRFRLLGRSEEGARIGPVTIYFRDVHDLLKDFSKEFHMLGFQLVITHQAGHDQLHIKMGVRNPKLIPHSVLKELDQNLLKQRPALLHEQEVGDVMPVSWEPVEVSELAINTRTGKLKRVIDLRSCSKK